MRITAHQMCVAIMINYVRIIHKSLCFLVIGFVDLFQMVSILHPLISLQNNLAKDILDISGAHHELLLLFNIQYRYMYIVTLSRPQNGESLLYKLKFKTSHQFYFFLTNSPYGSKQLGENQQMPSPENYFKYTYFSMERTFTFESTFVVHCLIIHHLASNLHVVILPKVTTVSNF